MTGSDDAWRELAACRGKPLEWFFAPDADTPGIDSATYYDKARMLCARCAVTAECADAADTDSLDHGFWGGMSPGERKRKRWAQRKLLL